ncbi:hypothetical protein [Rhodococcoides fascians]|uniref:hypothetical protein n=1 Tax=Rhodococcoides fascians TaxID=1828 RepID=UPI00050D04A6|nr:hypothetical protein [Rhodococcus fascians]
MSADDGYDYDIHDIDLDAVEQFLINPTTPAPWRAVDNETYGSRLEALGGQSMAGCPDCGTAASLGKPDAKFIAQGRTLLPALIERLRIAEATSVRELTPRVLEGDWETARDALDALPEGAQIRWRTGIVEHTALAIRRGRYWAITGYSGPLTSESIARDETPIEVIA